SSLTALADFRKSAPSHSRSQILGDDPELSQRRRLAFRIVSPNGKAKAMIDVIVDQRLLGVVDRVLDRLQLLSKLDAGPPAFDHADDRLKMPFRAPEAADDLGMVLVLHGPLPVLGPHTRIPPGRTVKNGAKVLECRRLDTAFNPYYIPPGGCRESA